MTEKKAARFKKFSESCPDCSGMGIITRYYGGGQFISEIDCKRCLGRGDIGNCVRCKGTGFMPVDEESKEGGVECPDCHGIGAIGDCIHCGGLGVMQSDEVDCGDCDGLGFLDKD